MSFNAPLNLLWLLPTVGAIVVLYLLRRPRRNIAVPSTALWSILPPDSPRAIRLQRLSPEILFFLQLLAAILMIFAAAGPTYKATRRGGTDWALVIDNGPTMQATDIPGGRLSAAVAAARSRITQSAPGDSYCVVTTAPARVYAPAGSSRSVAIAAVDAVRASDTLSDIPAAVAVAAAALHEVNSAVRQRIVIFGDAAWSKSLDASILSSSVGLPVGLAQVGTPSPVDLGIARLAVSRDPAQPTARLQALVQIVATGRAGSGTVTLRMGGHAVAKRPVSASPRVAATYLFSVLAPSRDEALTAHLSVNGRNDLAAGDTAYAIVPAAGVTRVLLISAGDPPLERALSLLPGVQTDVASPSAYRSTGAPSGYDVVIFDGVLPDPSRPLHCNVEVWGGNGPGFAAAPSSGPTTKQTVVDWSRSRSVMRFVDLYGSALQGPGWQSVGSWTPLIYGSAGILAAQDRRGNRSRIWFSLSPITSGIAAQPSFPIIVSDSIGWLAQGSIAETAAAPIALAPVSGGWRVADPTGDESGTLCSTSPSSPCAFGDTDTAGIYTARSSDRTLLFARSLAPAALSITPQPQSLAAAPPISEGSIRSVARLPETGAAALACLALLVAEWWVYHRRGTASLRRRRPSRLTS